MKRIASVFLAICLMLSVLSFGTLGITASAASYNGTCGTNLTWTLNTSTGVLTISGSGDMDTYSPPSYASDTAPWYFLRENIKSVVFDGNITSIGDYAFDGCAGLTGIEIPNTVTSVNYAAFIRCTGLTNIEIPEGVIYIGDWAFSECSGLKSLSIPKSVTSIDKYICWGSSLTDVYYAGSEKDRNNIAINNENDRLFDATWHYNSSGSSVPSYVLGNVDGDGFVKARDYQLLKRAVLKTYNLNETQTLAGDINGDEKITARDYQLLKRAVLGTYVIGK